MKITFDCAHQIDSGCFNNPNHSVESQKIYLVKHHDGSFDYKKLCKGYVSRANSHSYFASLAPVYGPFNAFKCGTCGNEENYELNSCSNCHTCCSHDRCDSPECSKCNYDTAFCDSCIKCKSHCACETCKECECKVTELCDCCEICLECCQCSWCEGCSRKFLVANCGECSYCETCCDCSFCHNCDNLTDCEDCGSCDTCCSCDAPRETYVAPDRANIVSGQVACGSRGWRAKHPSKRKVFNCDRLVGVEWEYNNCATSEELLKWTKKWKAGNHSDGSCGREVVTSPMSGDYIVECLSELGEAFKKCGTNVDDRCAIHVHVDASKFNWADMMRLLKVYALVEPLLYALGGHKRATNKYCIPCGSSYMLAMQQPDPKGSILNVAYGKSDGRRYRSKSNNKKDGIRYRGLNIVPWIAGRGVRKNKSPARPDTTVEFRIHKSSSDANQVIGWVKVCAKLVDWAYKASDKEVEALPKSPTKALTKIIAPDLSSWILDRIKLWRKESKESSKSITYNNGKYGIVGINRIVTDDAARAQLSLK